MEQARPPIEELRCERCDSTEDVSHWHDHLWCGVDFGNECGGWLCYNCAEALANP
jgi:hypothetical protein